ncbi:glutamate receptor 1-like [Lingula anatina]|uniref:Glutamate receptor 1-like n=1 Tax=Lingula anatina TaxID=7574 RepID=A0A1S3HSW3_LINAN|nr:glutamate receptor 1-like [Lingula anatina]|eukprot:XP_013389125.2 glutamate receptor 1-like [Lingula anatina]
MEMAQIILFFTVTVAVAMAQNASTPRPKFIVTTVLNKPFMMKKWQIFDYDSENDRYYGFVKDILEKVSKLVNFDYEIKEVDDGYYGTLVNVTAGEWNGMMKEIIDGTADIAVGDISITSTRSRYVGFSKPFINFGLVALLKKARFTPWEEVTRLFSLLHPFSAEVWVLVLVAFLVVSVGFIIIDRVNPYEWRKAADDGRASQGDKSNLGVGNSLFLAFSGLMWQGYSSPPRSIAGRTLACFWWIFVVFMLICYTASLTVLFLRPKQDLQPELPIGNVAELDKFPDKFTIGVLDHGSTQAFFRTSRIQQYVDIYSRMLKTQNESFVKSIDEGVEKVRNSDGSFVMVMESTTANYIANSKPCDLRALQEPITSMGYGFVTKKGVPVLNEINRAILRMQESGELFLLTKAWFADKCSNEKDAEVTSSNEGFVAVRLIDVAAPFVSLLIGLFLVILIVIGEILYYKFRGEREIWTPTSNEGDMQMQQGKNSAAIRDSL